MIRLYAYNNMLSISKKVIFLMLICSVQSGLLCSDICAPHSCTNQTENSCIACSTNWTIGSGTCALDPTSGYQLVAKSSDMTGSTSNLQMLPTSSLYTCGPYKYYGNYNCNTTMQISMPSGISVSHYGFQVIVWVLLYDDTSWVGSKQITVKFGSYSVKRKANTFDGQSSICQIWKQTYYKIVLDFIHENQTGTPITIDITNDITSSGCKWGFKQAMILAKSCDPKCTECFGSTSSECYSCQSPNYLSGSTCSASCISGYGPVTGSNICIQCDSKCTVCNNTATNCSACSNTSYLLGSTCYTTCPNPYYGDNNGTAGPNLCRSCNSLCTACTGPTNASCSACAVQFYTWFGGAIYYSLSGTTCMVGCLPGYGQASMYGPCFLCISPCASCYYSGSTCYSCQSTPTQFYLINTNRTCVSSCPSNYYNVSTPTYACYPCPAQCLTCENNTFCYSCSSGYLFYNNLCYFSCPIGTAKTNSTDCTACSNQCTSCVNLVDNCTSCQYSAPYKSYLLGNSCVAACPDGYFDNIIPFFFPICTACNIACLTCNGTGASNCITCNVSYVLSGTTCATTCISGYGVTSNQSLCLKCDDTCLQCAYLATNCTACGAYLPYLLNSSCLISCPNGYYTSWAGSTLCLSCDNKCTICRGSSINCSVCSSGNYLLLLNNSCLSSCPYDYYVYNGTTCNDTYVQLTSINLAFADLNQKLVFTLQFTNDLNQVSFPITTFQTFSFSNAGFDIQMFNFSYNWKSSNSYEVILQPNSDIYIKNLTLIAQIIPLPTVVQRSTDGIPFSSNIYGRSVSTKWYLIKGFGLSKLQKSIMNSFSAMSDSIQQFTTLPGVQQFNKAGLTALIFPGAQLTSASVLVNSVPAQNSYQGARFWANAVFFTVPKWQKDKQKQKYVLGAPAQALSDKSRLLSEERITFNVDSIYQRFERTGFTTFFIFDCYLQMLLIVISWFLLLIAKCLENRFQQSKISIFYSIFHCFHQISIYYLSLALILEIAYFDKSSVIRVVSFILCLTFNVYFVVYYFYVYYQLINYPLIQLGSQRYRQIVKKYGYFLKRIRYDQYEDIENWSAKHLFRPYNYHIVSFYKKYIMMIAVVMFYDYPHYAAGSLIFIQLFEITRFVLTWPFASKARNIIRLFLQIVILTFFLTLFLQTIYMAQIQQNNPSTISRSSKSFYIVGWISFICIFIFNLSFLIMLVVNLILFARKSNAEQIRQIRKDYYYQKIITFQKCADMNVSKDLLDSWVIKGDLIEEWAQDKEPDTKPIDITVQKFKMKKMGQGFMIQMEKITKLQIKQPRGAAYKHKVEVKEQINGTIRLTKQTSRTFYKIVLDIFQKYDPTFHTEFLTVGTIAKIQASRYRCGGEVDLNNEKHIQTVSLQYPAQKKKIHKLPIPLNGFPINPDILNPLHYNKTLDRKRIY